MGTKVEATLFIGDDNCVSAYDRPSRPNDIMKGPTCGAGARSRVLSKVRNACSVRYQPGSRSSFQPARFLTQKSFGD